MCSTTSRAEVFSHQVPRSDYTISGPEMFCTSLPTRRARAGIAGTTETFICSTLSCMLLQALLLYDTMMVPPVSTIKASDNITFTKHPQNNYLKIDPNNNYIQMVYQYGPAKPCKKAPPIVRAVKDSSFAIIRDPTDQRVSHLYYQDHKLHLREFCYDILGTRGTYFGEQVPKLCLSVDGHTSHFR